MFEKYFSLEEAAGMIPGVVKDFERAHVELGELKDQIILLKRVQMVREKSGGVTPPEEEALFQEKREAYERAFERWIHHFIDQGIQIRDIDRGLIDFPYRSKDGHDYLLCWQLGEEGLFYFHDTREGFIGRKPVTLLPD